MILFEYFQDFLLLLLLLYNIIIIIINILLFSLCFSFFYALINYLFCVHLHILFLLN